jgi:hypothetical protein
MWDVVSTEGSDGDDVASYFTDEEVLGPAERAEADRGIEGLRLRKQDLAFHFKVALQYLLTLAIRGPGILPLQGEDQEYFGLALERLRTQLDGIRVTVRGTQWGPWLSVLLEKFPKWGVSRSGGRC